MYAIYNVSLKFENGMTYSGKLSSKSRTSRTWDDNPEITNNLYITDDPVIIKSDITEMTINLCVTDNKDQMLSKSEIINVYGEYIQKGVTLYDGSLTATNIYSVNHDADYDVAYVCLYIGMYHDHVLHVTGTQKQVENFCNWILRQHKDMAIAEFFENMV